MDRSFPDNDVHANGTQESIVKACTDDFWGRESLRQI